VWSVLLQLVYYVPECGVCFSSVVWIRDRRSGRGIEAISGGNWALACCVHMVSGHLAAQIPRRRVSLQVNDVGRAAVCHFTVNDVGRAAVCHFTVNDVGASLLRAEISSRSHLSLRRAGWDQVVSVDGLRVRGVLVVDGIWGWNTGD
jgi:hypothetical protein